MASLKKDHEEMNYLVQLQSGNVVCKMYILMLDTAVTRGRNMFI